MAQKNRQKEIDVLFYFSGGIFHILKHIYYINLYKPVHEVLISQEA